METGGVSGAPEGETLEDIIRKAKKTPKFWSGDNPVSFFFVHPLRRCCLGRYESA